MPMLKDNLDRYQQLHVIYAETKYLIDQILTGQQEKFEIQLDDDRIDRGTYLLLVGKQLAVQRYFIYQQVQKLLGGNKQSFGEHDDQDAGPRVPRITRAHIAEIEQGINMRDLTRKVFDLYEFQIKWNPMLSMMKLKTKYSNE